MDYRQTAYEVMKLLLTDFTEEELRYCIDKAYDGKFDTEAIAPLAEVKNAWYLELFHGPTIAFKDMALSILPYLMTTAAKKNQKMCIRDRECCECGCCSYVCPAKRPLTQAIKSARKMVLAEKKKKQQEAKK